MPRPNTPLLLAALPLLALLALPVATLLVASAAASPWEVAQRPAALAALRLSLLTTSVSLTVTVLLGTPVAYLLARTRFPGRALVDALIDLPAVLPPVVAGVALLLVFGRRGLVGAPLAEAGIGIPFTTAAVVIAQVFVSAPFFVRALKVAFAAVPADVLDAARVDGAGGLRTFAFVTAPLAARGFVEGALLAWSRALGEFGATIVFAGSLAGRTRTLPLAIYAELERDLDAAIALAGILTLLAAVLFALVRFGSGRIPWR